MRPRFLDFDRMKASRSPTPQHAPRRSARADGVFAASAVSAAPVERHDAERAESTHDLQCGLQVTDVSDTMSNDLIDQLFRPAPLPRR